MDDRSVISCKLVSRANITPLITPTTEFLGYWVEFKIRRNAVKDVWIALRSGLDMIAPTLFEYSRIKRCPRSSAKSKPRSDKEALGLVGSLRKL